MTTLLKVCKKVVADAIDLEGYQEGRTLKNVVFSEIHICTWLNGYACEQYLRGLPSVCSIPFTDYDILSLLSEQGIFRKSDSAKSKLIDEYWATCGYALYLLVR